MNNTAATVLIFSCVIVGGCGSRSHDDPRRAAKTVIDAFRDGDAAAAEAGTVNANAGVIDAMCDLTRSQRRLHDAAVAHFGAAGDAVAPDNTSANASDVDRMIDAGTVIETGNAATLKFNSAAGTPGVTPVRLKKVNGVWKMDCAGMASATDTARIPVSRAKAHADDEIAADISAGKFAAPADARRALEQQVIVGMMTGMAPATTQSQ